jgi:mannose-1-phosphate guanylyltransferase
MALDITNKIFPIILAGGSGTRFWPVSRKAKPKQFLALGSSDESLIQSTSRRIQPLIEDGRGDVLVVTNSEMKLQVKEHLPGALIVDEPYARNTAACIGLAALEVLRLDPEGVMIVLPADHSVSDEACLLENLEKAVKLALASKGLVTVGIKPESPNTAYGYIKRAESYQDLGFKVGRFFEKPNLERAIEYCEAGDFYWNSGMFVWRAADILNAFAEYMPKLSTALEKIGSYHGSDTYQQVLTTEFEKLESISIDFGVLEHADNCYMVDAKSFGWNDVGSWDAWAKHFDPDKDGNISLADILQVQSKNCIVYANSASDNGSKRLIALLGVEDLVVVDTPDALMLCDRSKVQDIKLIVENLKKNNRENLI